MAKTLKDRYGVISLGRTNRTLISSLPCIRSLLLAL